MSGVLAISRLRPGYESWWNNLLSLSINASYRASIQYEYSKEFSGRKTETFLFRKDGELVAGTHYSLRSGLLNMISTGDMNSGIILKEGAITGLNDIIENFTDWGENKKVSYLRINPWLPEYIDGEKTEYSVFIDEVFKQMGFKILNKGRSTYWIDLCKNEEELFSRIHRKTRYDIRKAIDSGLKIEEVYYPDKKLISLFWKLLARLGKNKEFMIPAEPKFRHELKVLLDNKLAGLFVAKFRDEIVNISLSSKIGIASYMYGALNPEYSKLSGCPAPGHLAQWEMIRALKRMGLKTYDMGFCPGPVPDDDHPAFNIWRFKYRFGGKYVQYMPVYGKKLKPYTGSIFEYLKYRK